MTIERKTIRNFMEEWMRSRLFNRPVFTRYEVCEAFKNFTKKKTMSLDDQIELINTVKGLGLSIHTTANDDVGAALHTITFLVDPADTEAWERFMNSIYKEV